MFFANCEIKFDPTVIIFVVADYEIKFDSTVIMYCKTIRRLQHVVSHVVGVSEWSECLRALPELYSKSF